MRFAAVVGAELRKLRRAPIVGLSFLAYALFALMAYFVLWIIQNPATAAGLGLVGQKVNFLGEGLTAGWESLATFLVELGIMGGMIIQALVVIYLFGREYVEGTAKNLLALPLPRGYFVLAKTLVGLLWHGVLTAFLLGAGLAVGALLGFGPLPSGYLAATARDLFVAALLVAALEPLVALVTVASRGYLAPFGYLMLTLIVGNLLIRTEWARWCPWSIVALLSGMMGPRDGTILAGSVLVLVLTFLLGLGATILREARADNCQ